MKTIDLGHLLRSIIVAGVAVLWLIPTYLVVVNAMTSTDDFEGSPLWKPGKPALFENISEGWSGAGFGEAATNSLIYATVGSAVAVLIAALAAFALVVMPVKRKVLWFWIIYSGTLMPLQVFAGPLFSAATRTNLYDTRLGLGLVYVAICVPFALFVVRNFLTTLSVELKEAARLDGAGWLMMFMRIHLPLMAPAMAAAFVFQFVFIWNELFFGITLSISSSVQPVMAALAGLQGNYSGVGPQAVLAVALTISLPTIALFFGFQRFFASSLGNKI